MKKKILYMLIFIVNIFTLSLSVSAEEKMNIEKNTEVLEQILVKDNIPAFTAYLSGVNSNISSESGTTCEITIKSSNTKISKSSAVLYKGQSMKLKILGVSSKIVSWESNNKSVAIVKNGTVTARKAGTCIVTAKIGKIKKTCKIVVKKTAGAVSRKKQTAANSAYKKLIQTYEAKYGKAKLYVYGTVHYWKGVCFAKLLDFNNDGISELILSYQNGKAEEIKYHVELWSFDGKKAKRICSSVSWSGNNCEYFGYFSITKLDGKYLLFLSKGGIGSEIYYGKKSNGTLGAVHIFKLKGDAMKSTWYYNGKPISNNRYVNEHNRFNLESTCYSFSSVESDQKIRREIAQTKRILKM